MRGSWFKITLRVSLFFCLGTILAIALRSSHQNPHPYISERGGYRGWGCADGQADDYKTSNITSGLRF